MKGLDLFGTTGGLSAGFSGAPVSAYTLAGPTNPVAPLLISSPHSGRLYPADFAYSCPLPLLRQAEDFLVDELVAGATDGAATLIAATFPRSYIDLNRAEDDIDPAVLAEPWPLPLNPGERTLQGLGLVRRLCANGTPVYRRGLSVQEVQHRLTSCYDPYHAALAQALRDQAARFGQAWLIDAHSMPAYGHESNGSPRPDFVLGDRDGASCASAFTNLIASSLKSMGYSVVLNYPYKGLEILRRHGQPAGHIHALQLEINRRLYMNEATLEKTAPFDRLRRDLTRLFHIVIDHNATAQDGMAAE